MHNAWSLAECDTYVHGIDLRAKFGYTRQHCDIITFCNVGVCGCMHVSVWDYRGMGAGLRVMGEWMERSMDRWVAGITRGFGGGGDVESKEAVGPT